MFATRTRAVLLALGAIVAPLLVLGHGSAGGIDLTGDWDFHIRGEVTLDCEAAIVQTGTTVSGTFECGLASGSFNGTVTPEGEGASLTMDLTIAANGAPTVSAGADGTVAPDGNSFSGDWDAALFGLNGTFNATRAAPTPTATAEPTPSPGPALTQGDVDCDADVDSVDALKQLRHVAALAVGQNDPCPDIGSEVASLFGDVDCDNDVDSVDALKVLRHVAALPVSQSEPCTDVGEPLEV